MFCGNQFGPVWNGLNYPRLRFGYHISNLGTPRTQEISNLWNFPNSLIPRKLKSWGISWINYLIFMIKFSVLRVPRLSHSYFGAYFVTFTVNVRTFLHKNSTLVNFGISCLLLQTNAFSMAQDLGCSSIFYILYVRTYIVPARSTHCSLLFNTR